MSSKPSPAVNTCKSREIKSDILGEQETQSVENWRLIRPLTEKEVFTQADEEELEDIIAENSRDVAHAANEVCRRWVPFLAYLISIKFTYTFT
jgi:hypothetical protein